MKEGEMGPVPAAAWQKKAESCLTRCAKVGRGCLVSLLWLVGIVCFIFSFFWVGEEWTFYRSLGREMRFGAPCLHGGDGAYGYMHPVQLRPEAQALLAQWPRKLWPISYFLRFEGNQFVAPTFVYYAFLDEFLNQTRRDMKELKRFSKDPWINQEDWSSQDCSDYVDVATFGDWRSHPQMYTFIRSPDDPDPRIALALYLPRDFRKTLFEDRLDPFTGQPLPPPP